MNEKRSEMWVLARYTDDGFWEGYCSYLANTYRAIDAAFARLERGEIAQPKVTWVGINDGPWFPEVLWEPISAEMFNT